MAKPPIQYFRKEDFGEVKEPWVEKLLPKLNEMARQTTYGVDGKLSVQDNLSAFWWSGNIGNFTDAQGILFPFAYDPANIPPAGTKKTTSSISAFPFSFQNKITPAKIAAVMVAQAKDVTDGEGAAQPALLGGVAWELDGDTIRVSAINGMIPLRCYTVKLLVLGE